MNSLTSPLPCRQARSYLVGSDGAGHWLALETHGWGAGIFGSRQSALRYAAAETDHRPNAVRIAARRLSLAL